MEKPVYAGKTHVELIGMHDSLKRDYSLACIRHQAVREEAKCKLKAAQDKANQANQELVEAKRIFECECASSKNECEQLRSWLVEMKSRFGGLFQ